jgi:molybdopterin converting factor small subunit
MKETAFTTKRRLRATEAIPDYPEGDCFGPNDGPRNDRGIHKGHQGRKEKGLRMKVELKLFATFRQYLPPGTVGSAANVEIAAGARVSDLLSRFGVPHQGSTMILVNGRAAGLEQVLEENDVVAVFPAMAGG